MGRLAGITGRRAVRAFERAGFVATPAKGSHVALRKPGYPILVIPMHRSVSPFLLKSQIKRADLSEAEFTKLLK